MASFAIMSNDTWERIYRFMSMHGVAALVCDGIERKGEAYNGMYFCLRHMYRLQSRPNALMHEVFDTIFKISELLEMDEETRNKIIENMTTERDLKNQFEYARKEGRALGREEGKAEGRAEGRVEGRAEGRAETIRKMLASGVPAETIAGALGITVEECLSYKK